MENNASNATAAAWLIGGLAAGALINYVSDPQRGRQRREMLAGKISNTVSSTGDYLGQKVNQMGSKVQEIRNRADTSADVPTPGEQLELLPNQPTSVLTDPRFLKRAVNRELWMIAGAALGALAMFLADPDAGRRRRATANNKLRSAATSTRDYMASTSRDLGSRAQELMASARSKMPSSLKPAESTDTWQTH